MKCTKKMAESFEGLVGSTLRKVRGDQPRHAFGQVLKMCQYSPNRPKKIIQTIESVKKVAQPVSLEEALAAKISAHSRDMGPIFAFSKSAGLMGKTCSHQTKNKTGPRPMFAETLVGKRI